MIILKYTKALYYRTQFLYFMALAALCSCTAERPPANSAQLKSPELAQRMQAGDIVFIRIPFYPFKRVADDTGSWTNHVGVVTAADGQNITISESTFPFSGTTSLERFVARSANGRIAVGRMHAPLSSDDIVSLNQATIKRNGIFYDAGFNLHSRRQFCSRYVYESVAEATGQQIGEITTLEALLKNNPQAKLWFWRAWYFGNIPWNRQTITPASQLNSPFLRKVFDGYATNT